MHPAPALCPVHCQTWSHFPHRAIVLACCMMRTLKSNGACPACWARSTLQPVKCLNCLCHTLKCMRVRASARKSSGTHTLMPSPAWQLALMGNVHLHLVQQTMFCLTGPYWSQSQHFQMPMHPSKDDTEQEHMEHTECSFNTCCYNMEMQTASKQNKNCSLKTDTAESMQLHRFHSNCVRSLWKVSNRAVPEVVTQWIEEVLASPIYISLYSSQRIKHSKRVPVFHSCALVYWL